MIRVSDCRVIAQRTNDSGPFRRAATNTDAMSTRAIGRSKSKSRSVMLLVALLGILSIFSSLGGTNASAASTSSKSKISVATGSIA